LALEIGEGIDDFWSFVGSVSPPNGDLTQDTRLHETLDCLVRRLERAASQGGGAFGR
jgi:hypothetical protein